MKVFAVAVTVAIIVAIGQGYRNKLSHYDLIYFLSIVAVSVFAFIILANIFPVILLF